MVEIEDDICPCVSFHLEDMDPWSVPAIVVVSVVVARRRGAGESHPVAATKSASTALSANVRRMKAPFGPAKGLEKQTDREANARTDGSRRCPGRNHPRSTRP